LIISLILEGYHSKGIEFFLKLYKSQDLLKMNLNFDTLMNKTCFKYLIEENKLEIINLLLIYGLRLDQLLKYTSPLVSEKKIKFDKTYINKLFLECISKRNLDYVEKLLYHNPDTNYVDNNGFTALHYACQKNYTTIIPMLITEKNANLKNKDNYSPFMMALKEKHYDCALNILKSDYYIYIDFNHDNIYDIHSFLLYLINNKYKTDLIMKLLRQNNVNNHLTGLKRKTMLKVLLILIENRKYEDIKYILDNYKNYEPPVMLECKEKDFDFVINLLSVENIDMNIFNINKNDLIAYMIKNRIKNEKAFKWLLEKGAVISLRFFKSNINKIVGNESFIQSIKTNGFLISNISKYNKINNIKYPIIFSIQYKFINLLEKLLDYYDTVNEKDENGKPCIFYAIENNDEKYFNVLINSNKVCIEEKDNKGRTALDYAMKLNKRNISKLIIYKYVDIYEKDLNNNKNFKRIINSKFSIIYNKLMKFKHINYSYIYNTIIQHSNNKNNNLQSNSINKISIVTNNKKNIEININDNFEICKDNMFNLRKNIINNIIDDTNYEIYKSNIIREKENIIKNTIDETDKENKQSNENNITDVKNVDIMEDIENSKFKNIKNNNSKNDDFENINNTIVYKINENNNIINEYIDNNTEYYISNDDDDITDEFKSIDDDDITDEFKSIDDDDITNEFKSIDDDDITDEFKCIDDYDITDEFKSIDDDDITDEFKSIDDDDITDEFKCIDDDDITDEFKSIDDNDITDEFKSIDDSIITEEIECIESSTISHENESTEIKFKENLENNEINIENKINIDENNIINSRHKDCNSEENNDEISKIINFNENFEHKLFDNDENFYTYPELHYSCIVSNQKIIELMMINYEEDINIQCGKYKFTPLMILIYLEKYDCAQVLLEKSSNLDVNVIDIYENTPLIYMIKYGKINENIYELLIKKGAYINIALFSNDMFINQICKNEIFIKLLLDKTIKIKNEKDKIDIIEQPLIFAVKYNIKKLVKILIKHKADINEIFHDGNTPLLQAIEDNNIVIVKELINNGVNLMQPNNDEITPLEMAKINNYDEIVALIERRIYDNYSQIPSFYYNNKYDKASSNYNDELMINQLLLLKAIREDSLKKAKQLIQCTGIDVNYEHKNGITPLLYAIHLNKLKFVNFLISFRANVDIKNKNGITPIYYALQKGNIDIVKILIVQIQKYNNDDNFRQIIDREFNNDNILTFRYIINNKNKSPKKTEQINNTINRFKLKSNMLLMNNINKNHMLNYNKYKNIINYNSINNDDDTSFTN